MFMLQACSRKVIMLHLPLTQWKSPLMYEKVCVILCGETTEMFNQVLFVETFTPITKHYGAHSAGPLWDEVLTCSSTQRQVAAESHEAKAADDWGPTRFKTMCLFFWSQLHLCHLSGYPELRGEQSHFTDSSSVDPMMSWWDAGLGQYGTACFISVVLYTKGYIICKWIRCRGQ